MEFFLWLRCIYRNKCSFYGLILLYLGAIVALCVRDTDIRAYLTVNQVVCSAIFSICMIALGSVLFAVTACGYSTMHAYRKARIQHEKRRRAFEECLFLQKDYCVEIGWQMAAEDLGYVGGRA
jgi:hypothetical protein